MFDQTPPAPPVVVSTSIYSRLVLTALKDNFRYILGAVVTAGLGTMGYFVATQSNSLFTMLSSFGINFLISLLAGKGSVEVVEAIFLQKASLALRILEFALKTFGSILLASVYFLIPYAIDTNAYGARMGLSSAIGQAALNLYTFEAMASLLNKIKVAMRFVALKIAGSKQQIELEHKRQTVLKNLHLLRALSEKGGVTALPQTTSTDSTLSALENAQALAKDACTSGMPTHEPLLKSIFQGMVGIPIGLLLAISYFPYVCATDAGLGTVATLFSSALGFLGGAVTRFTLANVFMLCNYILGFVGGMGLGFSMVGIAWDTLRHKLLDNTIKIGGKLGKLLTFFAVAIPAVLAPMSGVPTKNYMEKFCFTPTSFLNFLESVPYSAMTSLVLAAAFNFVYGFLMLFTLRNFFVNLTANPQEKTFLSMKDMLEGLIQKFSTLPEAQLQDELDQLGGFKDQLDNPGYAATLSPSTERTPLTTEGMRHSV